MTTVSMADAANPSCSSNRMFSKFETYPGASRQRCGPSLARYVWPTQLGGSARPSA